MSNPLSAAVIQVLEHRNTRVWGVSGFRHSRPQPLPKMPTPHPDVESEISYIRERISADAPELDAEIDNYHHSSEVSDLHLLTPAFTVLTDKPPKICNKGVMFDAFIRLAMGLPRTQEGEIVRVEVPPITAGALSNQDQTTSTSGLLPLNSVFGTVVGSKKEMHEAAVAVNVRDGNGHHIPPAMPYKPSLKGEVIKKGKKVRGILLESQVNYQVLKHISEPLVSAWKNPAGGCAIGMSTIRGDFKQILFRWWLIRRRRTGCSWEEFLDWLEQQPAHESDKQAWEASTNMNDGFPFLLTVLTELKLPVDRFSMRLITRALADYVNPAIQVDCDGVYSVPWRTPSGSYWTAWGNSRRHTVMANFVCDFMESHKGCHGCEVCRDVEHLPWREIMVTPEEMEMARAFFVMGDDFLVINPHAEIFDRLTDCFFGTTTKTEIKPFFSVPGLFTPQGAEFLRRHFVREKRKNEPDQVYTFRSPARLLGKLFKGSSRGRLETFYAALTAAIWECGANRPIFEKLFGMSFFFVDKVNELTYKDALKQYLGKLPMLEDMTSVFLPTYNDLRNLDSDLISPLIWVKQSEECKELGMSPLMYAA